MKTVNLKEASFKSIIKEYNICRDDDHYMNRDWEHLIKKDNGIVSSGDIIKVAYIGDFRGKKVTSIETYIVLKYDDYALNIIERKDDEIGGGF